MDEQPRLTDLIPLRLSLYLVPLVVGLAIIAGFEALYAWSSRLSSLTTDGCIAALDLDTEGSLASWFSSTILLFAGLVAILVYLVRRHRKDDYQGFCRVWLWAAACCFLMSVDEGSSLHEGFKELMAAVTGTRLFGDGSIWWVVPYFFLLGSVGTRLLVEMRPCRLSTAAVMGTAACFGVAVLAQLGWIMPEEGARGVMLEEGAEMVGDLLLLLAMALHARYVILDARGLLPARKLKAEPEEGGSEEVPQKQEVLKATVEVEEEEATDDEEDDAETAYTSSVTVHPPHGVPRPASPAVVPASSSKSLVQPARPAVVAGQAAKPVSAASKPPEPQAKAKMTKAERKAMRKRLDQMRSDREQRLRGE